MPAPAAAQPPRPAAVSRPVSPMPRLEPMLRGSLSRLGSNVEAAPEGRGVAHSTPDKANETPNHQGMKDDPAEHARDAADEGMRPGAKEGTPPPRLHPELRPPVASREPSQPVREEARPMPRPDISRLVGARSAQDAPPAAKPPEPALRVNAIDEKAGDPSGRAVSFGRSDFLRFQRPSPAPVDQYSATLSDATEDEAADVSLTDVSAVVADGPEIVRSTKAGAGLGAGENSVAPRLGAPGEQLAGRGEGPRAEAPIADLSRREPRISSQPDARVPSSAPSGPNAPSGLNAPAGRQAPGPSSIPGASVDPRLARPSQPRQAAPANFDELADRNRKPQVSPVARRQTGEGPVEWPAVSRGPAARLMQREKDEADPAAPSRSNDSARRTAFDGDAELNGYGARAATRDGAYQGAHARELRYADGEEDETPSVRSGGRRPSAAEYQEAYRDYEGRLEKPSFLEGRMPIYLGATALGAIAVIGLALYLLRSPSTLSISDTPPVIAAPTEPAKIQPEEGAQQPVVPRQTKLIYDRILGDEQGGGEERLVPRQEEPLTPGIPNEPAPVAPDTQGGLPPAVPPPPGNQSSLEGENPVVAEATGIGEGGIAPDISEAGLRIPGQGANPSGSSDPPDADVSASGAPDQETGALGAASGQRTATAPLPKPKPAAQRRVASAQNTPAETSPTQGATVVPSGQSGPQLASVGPTPTALSSGQYLIQLASFRTQQDAATEFNRLKRSFPQLLGNLSPFIQEADLGDRGKFYRLRMGPIASQDGASQLCNSLIASGEKDCLVRRQQ
ncbi:SPOR domain-containing protein [Rhodoligotrophos ferricapiens]|uniref:SPOR domain-containing protein n=1 Tax=Rhodoligotrophos ferricapiens TaxID=3069264 RepID=UPI00315CAC1F